MKKLLVLLGSGEYTTAVYEIDTFVLSKIPQRNGPLLLIPTAAGQEPDYLKWNHLGHKHFEKLGIKAQGLAATTREELDSKKNLALLLTASLVYFSGGRPGYLFSQLENSEFLTILTKKYHEGTPIVASSAGAMVMGSYFLANPYEIEEQGQEPLWKRGLGFADLVVLPHYNQLQHSKSLQDTIQKAPQHIKEGIVGIDENTAYILSDNEAPLRMGQGKITFV